MYHRATILSGLTGLALLGPVALCADRGSIPFNHGVQIFEPVQRALIAWNGEEEILLLSTDLRTSEPTKVLEVLPLPAEPKVTKGDTEVFRRATALINRKLMEQARADAKAKRESTVTPAGEVTFHERIGAHDISVVRRSGGWFCGLGECVPEEGRRGQPADPRAAEGGDRQLPQRRVHVVRL